MTDPVSDLAVCRQRLDVLEQQAKAAEEATGTNWRVEDHHGETDMHGFGVGWQLSWDEDGSGSLGRHGLPLPLAQFWAACSPADVLAWVGWIRQTLDGAEATTARHRRTPHGFYCMYCSSGDPWPCPDYTNATDAIAGLAAVLAPDQAVKP